MPRAELSVQACSPRWLVPSDSVSPLPRRRHQTQRSSRFQESLQVLEPVDPVRPHIYPVSRYRSCSIHITPDTCRSSSCLWFIILLLFSFEMTDSQYACDLDSCYDENIQLESVLIQCYLKYVQYNKSSAPLSIQRVLL